MNNDFDKYYYNFLGIDNLNNTKRLNIIPCDKRDKPLNKIFLYPLIISFFNNTIYLSISPKYYTNFKEYIEKIDMTNINKTQLKEIITVFFGKYFEKFEVETMSRLCKFDDLNIDDSEALVLNEKNKHYFMNTGKRLYDKEFKERKWNDIKNITSEERAYIIPKKDSFISLAYISDIELGGANIVVETNEDYRKQGYGKKVVSRVVKWCNDNNLLPIYFVNNNNGASKKLAESTGFKIMSEELVVRIVSH